MNDQVFLDKIEGHCNDLQAGVSDKKEVMNGLLQVFLDALGPEAAYRKDLELLMTEVAAMRLTQKKYFDGDKAAIVQARKRESAVDGLMTRLCYRYNIFFKDIAKPEQQPLF